MKNLNKILFFSALCAGNLTSFGFFDMQALEEQIDKQMKIMYQSMQQMENYFKSNAMPTWPAANHQGISLDSSDTKATVTIYDIEIENLEATLNDATNRLTISTPTKKIVIATRDTVIAIEAQEIIKQDAQQKEGTAHYIGTSINRMEQSVLGKLLLDQQTVDYNPATKELIVTIPLAQSTKGKVIPINKIAPTGDNAKAATEK